jgi:CheY-like chemotaxis protein
MDALLAADRDGRLPHLVLVGHVRDAGADLDIASGLGGDARLARVPLVLVPVSGMRGHARAVREAGYAAYLPRPLHRGELKECVRAVLLRPATARGSMAGRADEAGAAPLLTRHRLADENRLAAAGRVLVVDDDPANRTVTRLQVERLGYPADAVENGAQAVAAVMRGDYQVVLMDCHMPTMNGLMATAEIRRLDTRRHGPPAIVAVTAEAGDGWAQRCREAGIDDVLEKPVRAHQLAETLNRHARTPSRSAGAQQIAPLLPARISRGIDDLVSEVGLELTLDLARDYLTGVRKALENMRSAGIETTKADAHRLLGSARMLGLPAFESLWPRVEELAGLYDRIPDATVDELRLACIELESWIEGHHEKQRA